VVFVAAVAIQGIAMRMATHRPRISAPTPSDECDIIASALPALAPAESVVLPEMITPVAGGRVPHSPDRLPGATREYRGGVHEGVDFRCHPGEPVHAAADGWVLSIEDEPNLPESRRSELLSICRELGQTPPEVLRVLHGRRITLRHETSDGHLLTTSYSHLASIRPDLKPGVRVREGEVIGASGASGTSHAYRHDGWGEVHFELRIDGQPLGLGLPAVEARELFRERFGEHR
jgi:murein DD-endopeptidase MepM/ murein hydrolase activator NlpD